MSVESRCPGCGIGPPQPPSRRLLRNPSTGAHCPLPICHVLLPVIWRFPLPQAQRAALAVKANLLSGPAEPSRLAILEALRAGLSQ